MRWRNSRFDFRLPSFWNWEEPLRMGERPVPAVLL